jgi:hypothetical protein
LKAWANWQPKCAPYVLGPDGPVLDTARSREAIVNIKGSPQAYSAPDFGGQNASRLHLGLLPQPFLGDLRRASIYILLLNPGLGPTDYYGEYEVPSYRKALQANLKQRVDKDSVPFLFLDPPFAWHGGFGWWHAKLGSVILRFELIARRRVSGQKRRCQTEIRQGSVRLDILRPNDGGGLWK